MSVLKADFLLQYTMYIVPECVVEQSQVSLSVLIWQPSSQFAVRVIGISVETEADAISIISSNENN